MSATAQPQRSLPVLQFADIVLIVVAAPIMLLIGVSPLGYLVGAGVWIVLRLGGIGVERVAGAMPNINQAFGVRMGYMLFRLFVLAVAVILVRQSGGQGAGLAALVLVVLAFTIALAISAKTRPRSSR